MGTQPLETSEKAALSCFAGVHQKIGIGTRGCSKPRAYRYQSQSYQYTHERMGISVAEIADLAHVCILWQIMQYRV